MKFVDALNALIAHGVTAEMVATTNKKGESFVILTDAWMPSVNFAAHAVYGVTAGGVIEGYWMMQEEGDGFAIHWDAQPDQPMTIPLGKLHLHAAGFVGLNDRLTTRMKATT